MELPKHIADMCGIVVDAGKTPTIPNEEYQAIRKIWDDTDGVFSIMYRGETVGWISESCTEARGPKYRALTVNHRIDRFYTFSQAMTWLLEEAF